MRMNDVDDDHDGELMMVRIMIRDGVDDVHRISTNSWPNGKFSADGCRFIGFV